MYSDDNWIREKGRGKWSSYRRKGKRDDDQARDLQTIGWLVQAEHVEKGNDEFDNRWGDKGIDKGIVSRASMDARHKKKTIDEHWKYRTRGPDIKRRPG